MSILNNSIPPDGQKLFPAKVSVTREDALCHTAHSLKPFQPNSKKTPSFIAKSESVRNFEQTTSTTHNVDFEPIALHFLCRPLKHTTNVVVLDIAVSSAVKLDDTQIDLIARKMQRLTGFRHLRLENVVDPSLIAGFVISVDDSHVIDFSVKGQLASLAAQVESSDQRLANRGKSWS